MNEERRPEHVNAFEVAGGAYNFTLRFGYRKASTPSARPEERPIDWLFDIDMSPTHLKHMVKILSQVLESYEKQIGEIPIPPEKKE